MLRYMANGPRDFHKKPVPPIPRLNWEFYLAITGSCAPVFPHTKSPEPKEKTLWVLPPHLTYGWRSKTGACNRVVFHFGAVPDEISEPLSTRKYLAVPLTDKEIEEVLSLAASLKVHWEKPHQYSHLYYERALIDLSLLALKDKIIKPQIPLRNRDSERVERAIAWYLVNMTRNPTVEEVASIIHVSATHLRRQFKAVRGKNPHKVFRELQLRRATELLATTSDTLDLISSRCGFQNVTDFSRVFRKEMKTTPDNWRKKLLAKSYAHLDERSRGNE